MEESKGYTSVRGIMKDLELLARLEEAGFSFQEFDPNTGKVTLQEGDGKTTITADSLSAAVVAAEAWRAAQMR